MSLSHEVGALMREVAAEVIMPRYRALGAGDIEEKSPGEFVTCADRESEERLREGLDRLRLGARIVGEEACAARPALLDGIDRGLVWLVDPLDGTSNFASGTGPFGMMIALVEDGEPLASWMFDPVSGRMCRAERGFGAWIDDERVRVRSAEADTPVAALATQFMTAVQRRTVHARAGRRFVNEPIPRCAAESYPRLVLGRNQVALFQRILPWDHAPGVLFLTEAGGHATHWNARTYRVGGNGNGLLVAATPRHWEIAADALLSTVRGIAPLGTPGSLAA